MVKIRKIILFIIPIILLSSSILYCEDLETSDISDSNPITDYSSDFDNLNNGINGLSSDLSSLTDMVGNLQSSINSNSSLSFSDNIHFANNFDFLSTELLNFYYLHFNDYKNISFYSSTNNMVFSNLDLSFTIDNNIVSDIGAYGNHLVVRFDGTSFNYTMSNKLSGNGCYILKLDNTTNNYFFSLVPYKLTLINNTSFDISFDSSINNVYFDSLIFYDNQSIKLSIDNSDNVPIYWCLNDSRVSDDNTYIFNIDSTCSVSLNYLVDSVDYESILMVIVVILLFLLFKSMIWGV